METEITKVTKVFCLHEVLGLPSGVEDGSDGGEGEGDEEEEEGGDDAGRCVQSLLRCVGVDLPRLEDEHNSGKGMCRDNIEEKEKQKYLLRRFKLEFKGKGGEKRQEQR